MKDDQQPDSRLISLAEISKHTLINIVNELICVIFGSEF